MLALKFIRENPELVREGARKKKIEFDLDRLLELDAALLGLNRGIDDLRNQQKTMGKRMGDASPEERDEILAEQKTLYPQIVEPLEATETLTKEGFQVMAYCTDDPIMCNRLEAAGAVAIMPVGAPIGSGLGIQNRVNIRLIVEQSSMPVIVDAGIGTASDATIAMELGGDGVLINTAIAEANDPIRMARAMKAAVKAGRDAYLAGRMAKKMYADPTSPLAGLI